MHYLKRLDDADSFIKKLLENFCENLNTKFNHLSLKTEFQSPIKIKNSVKGALHRNTCRTRNKLFGRSRLFECSICSFKHLNKLIIKNHIKFKHIVKEGLTIESMKEIVSKNKYNIHLLIYKSVFYLLP